MSNINDNEQYLTLNPSQHSYYVRLFSHMCFAKLSTPTP